MDHSVPESRLTTALLFVALLVMIWVTATSRDNGPSYDDLRFGEPHICVVFGIPFQTVGNPYLNPVNGRWAFLDAASEKQVHGKGSITCLALPPQPTQEKSLQPRDSVRESSWLRTP